MEQTYTTIFATSSTVAARWITELGRFAITNSFASCSSDLPVLSISSFIIAAKPSDIVGPGSTLFTVTPDLRAIDEKVRVIAQATHHEAQGETLRSSLRQSLAALPSTPLNKRVLFILSHGGMTAMAAGQQTGADAAIRAAGLQNAMQGFTRYQPLSQEGVMASQPDLVVISQDGLNALGGEENVWKLPGLAQTPAGRSKQIGRAHV